MFYEPETWVAIAFVILMVLFAYLGIHRTVLKALDHRAERIKAELDDARRLKDEAAKLLADYKSRRASAEREAQEIISGAQAEKAIAATRETAMSNVRGIAADAASAIVQRLTGVLPDSKAVNSAVDASLKG